MKFNQIKEFLLKNKGYLKKSPYIIAERLSVRDISLVTLALKQVKNEIKSPGIGRTEFPVILETSFKNQTSNNIFKQAFIAKDTEYDIRVKNLHNYANKQSGKNVLVIGDLHLPFTLDGYLEHCIEIYNKYKCNEVVFIGDIIDLHFSSYHETSTEGYGATQEHDLSVEMIKKWYKAFPKAYVTIGNHDALIYRKAMSAGISKRWIQDFSQVLGTPGWQWVTDVIIDDVLYTHGTTNAYNKAKQNLMSTVQGHLHSQAGIQFYVGSKTRIFGFQVGCGVDMKTYAMEYGRNFPKPVISCGVVIDGLHPYLEVMNL